MNLGVSAWITASEEFWENYMNTVKVNIKITNLQRVMEIRFVFLARWFLEVDVCGGWRHLQCPLLALTLQVLFSDSHFLNVGSFALNALLSLSHTQISTCWLISCVSANDIYNFSLTKCILSKSPICLFSAGF